MNFFTSAKRVMAVLTIAAVPAVVFAYDFKEGNLCFEKLADGASVKVVKDDSYAAALVGSLTIPESVMNDGVSYSVAEIDYRAFAQCQALTSVVIPNSLKVVGGSAFYMCKALTSVTNLAASPQSITKYVFRNLTYSQCNLYVPEQSVGLYNSASYWRSFKIEGINGVDGVEADEAAKVVEGYYDLMGARLAEPVRGEVNLVRYTDGTARKVIVE